MNYSMCLYSVFAFKQGQIQILRGFDVANGMNTVYCKEDKKSYSANIEDVVCLECRNAKDKTVGILCAGGRLF